DEKIRLLTQQLIELRAAAGLPCAARAPAGEEAPPCDAPVVPVQLPPQDTAAVERMLAENAKKHTAEVPADALASEKSKASDGAFVHDDPLIQAAFEQDFKFDANSSLG
ncbi:unnamed protein product, partial [Prorocentrum cordatum]